MRAESVNADRLFKELIGLQKDVNINNINELMYFLCKLTQKQIAEAAESSRCAKIIKDKFYCLGLDLPNDAVKIIVEHGVKWLAITHPKIIDQIEDKIRAERDVETKTISPTKAVIIRDEMLTFLENTDSEEVKEVFINAAEYFRSPILEERLYQFLTAYKAKHEPSQYTQLIKMLADIVAPETEETKVTEETEKNSKGLTRLKVVLPSIHPDLALKIVKLDSTKFHILPQSLQKTVQRSLIREKWLSKENKDKKESVSTYEQIQQYCTHDRKKENVLEKLLANDELKRKVLEKVKAAAIRKIDEYIYRNPDQYKIAYFKAVREKLLALKDVNTILLTCMQDITIKGHEVDYNRLFSKSECFGGPEASRAAKLSAELYQLFTGTSTDKKQLVNGKGPVFESKLNPKKDQRITNLISGAYEAKPNANHPLHSLVVEETQKLINSSEHFLQRDVAADRMHAEAVYQQYIITKGFKIAETAIADRKHYTDLRFDVQGSALVRVTLSDEDYDKIYKQITGKDNNQTSAKTDVEKLLGITIGKLPTATYCNLDIRGHARLYEWFIQYAKFTTKAGDISSIPGELAKPLMSFIKGDSRHSVIALQQELEHNLLLLLRVTIEKIDEKIIKAEDEDKPKWQALKGVLNKPGYMDKVFSKLNLWVMEQFREALKSAWDESTQKIDYTILNEKLREARVSFVRDDHEFSQGKLFIEAFAKDNHIYKNDLVAILNHVQDKLINTTTAMSDDYLKLSIDITPKDTKDKNQRFYGSATRITATEVTSHDKKRIYKGDAKEFDETAQTAERVLNRTQVILGPVVREEKGIKYIDEKETKSEESTAQISIQVTGALDTGVHLRVPSEIGVNLLWGKTHNVSIAEYQDIIKVHDHTLRKLLGNSKSPYIGPLVYNSLLSHYHVQTEGLGFIDPLAGNRQRRQLARTQHAMHLHNFEQVKAGHKEALAFMMDIPINQHTNEISLDYRDLRGEMALMAEIAMLASLKQNAAYLTPLQRNLIEECYTNAHKLYVQFLTKQGANLSTSGNYFRNSSEGIECVGQLQLFKEVLNAQAKSFIKDPESKEESKATSTTTVSVLGLVTQAVAKIQRESLYTDKQFGFGIQVLSAFLEEAAMGGCKSANDRWPAVAAGVGLLSKMQERAILQERAISKGEKQEFFRDHEKGLITLLQGFMQGKNTMADLQVALGTAINAYNMQDAEAQVPANDNGAPPKLAADSNTDPVHPNKVTSIWTNIALPSFFTNAQGNDDSAKEMRLKPKTFQSIGAILRARQLK